MCILRLISQRMLQIIARIRAVFLLFSKFTPNITFMQNTHPHQDLIEHLCRHSAMSANEAQRLVCEVLAFYDEPVSTYVRRRHHDLQRSGMNNKNIYKQIASELTAHRFAAEPMTERQIRRAIYG